MPAFKHTDKRGRRSNLRPDLYIAGLAEEVGIDRSYLSRVLRGIHTPSLKVAMRLSAALGITVEQLWAELDMVKGKEKKPKRKVKAKPKAKSAT